MCFPQAVRKVVLYIGRFERGISSLREFPCVEMKTEITIHYNQGRNLFTATRILVVRGLHVSQRVSPLPISDG